MLLCLSPLRVLCKWENNKASTWRMLFLLQCLLVIDTRTAYTLAPRSPVLLQIQTTMCSSNSLFLHIIAMHWFCHNKHGCHRNVHLFAHFCAMKARENKERSWFDAHSLIWHVRWMAILRPSFSLIYQSTF